MSRRRSRNPCQVCMREFLTIHRSLAKMWSWEYWCRLVNECWGQPCTQSLPNAWLRRARTWIEFLHAKSNQLVQSVEPLDNLRAETADILEFCLWTDLFGCEFFIACISQVNPWLTYFPELHAIREGGTNLRLLDLLDERPFTGDEIRKFMQMFMVSSGTSRHMGKSCLNFDDTAFYKYSPFTCWLS